MPKRSEPSEPSERLEPTGEGWVKRIRRAWRRYQGDHGDITQEEVGARVAQLLGRQRPFTRQQINDYFTATEPRFTVGVAIAVALEVQPTWLAFGDEGLAAIAAAESGGGAADLPVGPIGAPPPPEPTRGAGKRSGGHRRANER